jgi:hypothetical protein
MTTPTASTKASTYRFAGWAAIASGFVGIISIACLIAYLATQARQFMEAGVMPPLGAVFTKGFNVGGLLQALCMIPVGIALHTLARQRSPGVSQAAVVVGVIALAGVASLRLLLLLNPAVPDILFMGPMGFVGAWLIVVNWLLAGLLPRMLRIVGTVAGVGLVILGASFFFLGGLAVLTDGPSAYANDVDFHVGIRIGGFPGFILYPIWAILLGRRLLRAQHAVGQAPGVVRVA